MPRSKRKPMSDINVVPYIDVMLVLLVIFMATAPLLTQGIKVDLPQTTSDPLPQDEEEPLIVTVNAAGGYFIELGENPTEPLELPQVSERVSKILAANPAIKVLVRGDRNVSYGVVVALMSTLQQAGASGVGLISENPPEA